MREEGSSLNVLHVGGGREGPRDRAVVGGGDKEMDQIAQTLYRLAKQVEGMRESRDQMGVEQSPGTAVGQQVCAENSAGNGSGLDAVVSRQGKPHDTAVNDRSLFCQMCVCLCMCLGLDCHCHLMPGWRTARAVIMAIAMVAAESSRAKQNRPDLRML